MASAKCKVLVSSYLSYRQGSEHVLPLRQAMKARDNTTLVFDENGKNPRKVAVPLIEVIGDPLQDDGEPEVLFKQACEMYGFKLPEPAPVSEIETVKEVAAPPDDKMMHKPLRSKLVAMTHADTRST